MASITLIFTTAQTNLLASAIGWELGLGRDATLAEAKTWFNLQAKGLAERYQRYQAAQTAAITDMTAT